MAAPKPISVPRRRRPKLAVSSTQGTGEQYHLKAIGRGLDVLECFTDARPRLSLMEITHLVGLPESTLFRVLLTLQSRGYLDQNPDGTYELAPRLLLGRLHERAEQMRAVLWPHLQDLASRFDETASAAYLFRDHIQALDTVETFQEIRMTNKPGRVLPPHCSSLGKAITAFQERPHIDRILEVYGLFRRTEKTVIDRAALHEEFTRIRAEHLAYDREESVSGGFCMAAPIGGTQSPVSAAISVSTPVMRMTDALQKEISAALRQIARQVAHDLESKR